MEMMENSLQLHLCIVRSVASIELADCEDTCVRLQGDTKFRVTFSRVLNECAWNDQEQRSEVQALQAAEAEVSGVVIIFNLALLSSASMKNYSYQHRWSSTEEEGHKPFAANFRRLTRAEIRRENCPS